MQKASLIGHTIEAYTIFAQNSSVPADAVLRRFFLGRKYLGSTDRRAIASAYFGAIKNFLRLEAIAQDAYPSEVHKPDLIIAAFSIVFEGEDPEHVRSYLSELTGPDSRGYPRQPFQIMADRGREQVRLASLSTAERLSVLHSFPEWFVSAIIAEYDEASAENILIGLNAEAPTSLRVNTAMISREALQQELAEQGIETEISAISDDGIILRKRMNIWDLASFKRGAFEIQDEASQLVAPFAAISSNRIKLLDACAGAGGKTLHFSSLLKNKGEIFATDLDNRKLEELKKRVVRSKAQNIRIIDPASYDKVFAEKSNWFDIVLLDVPCSGTGTLRRNPSIKWNLTEEMLSELKAKQQTILEQNSKYVRSGGTLLYATCSILKSEGEERVEAFCIAHPDFSIEETRRTHPETDGCDGFFVARLKRS
ncbi:MAG: class I SAM-dependent methyltransferase [Ignavibacteriota bacterium]